MKTKESDQDEAIRRLLSRTRLEMTSADFTSRLMEKIEAVPEPKLSWHIRFQGLIIFSSLCLAVILLYFPIWTWFGFEFTPGQFISFYAAEGFRYASEWIGNALSHLGAMGKLMYLIPVSVAMLLLVAFDQGFRRPAHKASRV